MNAADEAARKFLERRNAAKVVPLNKNLSPGQFAPEPPPTRADAPDVPGHIAADKMKARRFALARDREELDDNDIDILDEAAFGPY